MKKVEFFIKYCGPKCPHYNINPVFHSDEAECELLDCRDPRMLPRDDDDAFPLECPLDDSVSQRNS